MKLFKVKMCLIIGSYQLNDYNNDPDFSLNMPLGMYEGTCKNIQLYLPGNIDEGVGWYNNSNS